MASLSDRLDAASTIPVGLELGLASLLALLLLIKGKTKGNFPLLIAYSAVKLLALCDLISRNMTLFGIGHIPFLVGLLLNEVVLLVLSIRLRDIILQFPFGNLYPIGMRVVRALSELTTIIVIVGVISLIPFVTCSCNVLETRFDDIVIRTCELSGRDRIIGSIIKNQLRGLAFAITVTASVAAISSMRFMMSSVGKEMTGKEDRDVIKWMMMDAGWKQSIRTVYGVLGFFVNALFVGTFFYRGTNDCIVNDNNSLRYGLGPISTSLLNAIMAISQVFMADMLLRISAKAVQEEMDNKKPFQSNGAISADSETL